MQLNLRYLTLGTTDGTLIALGIVTATRGLASLHLTLAAAVAGVLSSALSNAFGAYIAESVIADQELTEYARHLMVPSLSATRIGRASRSRTYAYTATMALFVLVGAMVPLLPIALLGSGIFARALVVVASLVTLFCLGAYAGVRIKKNVFTMGLLTSLVGMIVWGLAWAIGEVLAGA